jgi:hypothetical protein
MNYLLTRSLEESLPIEIIYQSKDKQFTKRVILVKGINKTYINAYCYYKKQARIFKIDSILAVAPIKESKKRFYA